MTPKPKPIKCDFSNRSLYNRSFISLFENKSEFLHLWGSAGSGKSVFAAQKEIVLSYDSKRKNRKTIVARKVADTHKNSTYAELKGVIYDWNLTENFKILKSPLSIVNKLTGVEFIFVGLDDLEKLKSITKADRAWIEEATELKTKDELDQIRLRLRGFEEVQVTLSYNPIDEHHWLNTEIHDEQPEGHDFHHSTYRDNEKLLAKDPHYGPRIESYKESNPNYYRVYGLGLWGQVVEGLIYKNFTKGAFPQKDGTDDIHAFGLDFGFTNECALVAVNIEDAIPKKKLHWKEWLYKSDLDAVELVAEFDSLKVPKNIKITADNARPEMIKALRKAGYNVVKSKKFAGSVLSGINDVRAYDLVIDPGSKNILKEIRNYQKQEKNGQWLEEPAPNQVDHTMDGGRYGLEPFTTPATAKVGVLRI